MARRAAGVTIAAVILDIVLHREAPEKPQPGAPCNGCGVCCAMETCPVARMFLLGRRVPCAALEWQAEMGRYRCGMAVHPSRYVGWLPRRWDGWLARRLARRISACSGCDCDAAPFA